MFNPIVSSGNSAGKDFSDWNGTAGTGGNSQSGYNTNGSDGLIILEGRSSPSRFGTSLTVIEGQQAVFVIDNGIVNESRTYTWYKKSTTDVLISSVSSPIYTIPSTVVADAGDYYCIIKNSLGQETKSKIISLYICGIPKITAQPSVPATTMTSTPNTSVVLNVVANGNGVLTYQWYKNNSIVPNEISSSITRSLSTTNVDLGSYFCVVKNTLNDVSASKMSDTALVGSSVNASGGGGGEAGCPAPWMRILLSDGSLIEAGKLKAGMFVKTKHEHTFEEGDYEVIAVSTEIQPRISIIFDHITFVGSQSHKFYSEITDTWINAINLKVGDIIDGHTIQSIDSTIPNGEVIKISVDTARTYIVEGMLSHNTKKAPLVLVANDNTCGQVYGYIEIDKDTTIWFYNC